MLEEGIVKSGDRHLEQGVGVRAQVGERQGYAHSDELSARGAPARRAHRARDLRRGAARGGRAAVRAAAPRRATSTPSRSRRPTSGVASKIELVEADRPLCALARSAHRRGDGELRHPAPHGARDRGSDGTLADDVAPARAPERAGDRDARASAARSATRAAAGAASFDALLDPARWQRAGRRGGAHRAREPRGRALPRRQR